MKEGKMFYWALQGPPHHKWLKAAFTESLKAKKQSIEAIAEVSKYTNKKRSFREGPSFYQGRPNGGQKFRSNYNGKYIFFQKQ